jgi:hypothetical protein
MYFCKPGVRFVRLAALYLNKACARWRETARTHTNANKRGLFKLFRVEAEIAGATVFLPHRVRHSYEPEETKPITYEVLEAVKEILPEGAKIFAPAEG